MSSRKRTRGRTLLSVAAALSVLGIGIVLSTSAGAARQAARASTGGRIVFQAKVGKFPQVFTIAPDGTGLRQITEAPAKGPGAENPTWSPDGSRIAFDTSTSTDGNAVNLFTVAPDGGAVTELPLDVGRFNGDPAYSPDGAQISFDQDVGRSEPTVHGIFVADSDGSDARRLTTGLPTTKAFDTESQWSPDGTRLAFTRVKNERQAAIFTVRLDGTGLEQLTPYKLDAASPDYSPDGSTIAFNSYYDSPGGKSANVFTIPADGGPRTALTHHSDGVHFSFRPSWSPDGSRIVFTRAVAKRLRDGGGVDLYTMRADGSGRTRLTDMPKQFPTNADWGKTEQGAAGSARPTPAGAP